MHLSRETGLQMYNTFGKIQKFFENLYVFIGGGISRRTVRKSTSPSYISSK